jgi:hypothetical protein
VLIQAFLCRLVVIGRDDEHGIGAGALGMAGKLDRLRGRIRARARYDGDPTSGLLDAPFHNLVVFLVG